MRERHREKFNIQRWRQKRLYQSRLQEQLVYGAHPSDPRTVSRFAETSHTGRYRHRRHHHWLNVNSNGILSQVATQPLIDRLDFEPPSMDSTLKPCLSVRSQSALKASREILVDLSTTDRATAMEQTPQRVAMMSDVPVRNFKWKNSSQTHKKTGLWRAEQTNGQEADMTRLQASTNLTCRDVFSPTGSYQGNRGYSSRESSPNRGTPAHDMRSCVSETLKLRYLDKPPSCFDKSFPVSGWMFSSDDCCLLYQGHLYGSESQNIPHRCPDSGLVFYSLDEANSKGHTWDKGNTRRTNCEENETPYISLDTESAGMQEEMIYQSPWNNHIACLNINMSRDPKDATDKKAARNPGKNEKAPRGKKTATGREPMKSPARAPAKAGVSRGPAARGPSSKRAPVKGKKSKESARKKAGGKTRSRGVKGKRRRPSPERDEPVPAFYGDVAGVITDDEMLIRRYRDPNEPPFNRYTSLSVILESPEVRKGLAGDDSKVNIRKSEVNPLVGTTLQPLCRSMPFYLTLMKQYSAEAGKVANKILSSMQLSEPSRIPPVGLEDQPKASEGRNQVPGGAVAEDERITPDRNPGIKWPVVFATDPPFTSPGHTCPGIKQPVGVVPIPSKVSYKPGVAVIGAKVVEIPAWVSPLYKAYGIGGPFGPNGPFDEVPETTEHDRSRSPVDEGIIQRIKNKLTGAKNPKASTRVSFAEGKDTEDNKSMLSDGKSTEDNKPEQPDTVDNTPEQPDSNQRLSISSSENTAAPRSTSKAEDSDLGRPSVAVEEIAGREGDQSTLGTVDKQDEQNERKASSSRSDTTLEGGESLPSEPSKNTPTSNEAAKSKKSKKSSKKVGKKSKHGHKPGGSSKPRKSKKSKKKVK